jgi:pimeloyl-ACP methyl ester carboxylesterase
MAEASAESAHYCEAPSLNPGNADTEDNKMMLRKGVKVLYLHGLESGPRGAKARYLQRKFEDVCAPDLETGAMNFRTNSMLVHAIWNFHYLFMGSLYTQVCNGMLNGAAAIGEEAAKQFQPDIVVASSMGGATALELIKRGVIKVPTLLLAPALKKLKLGAAESSTLDPAYVDSIMNPWYEEFSKQVLRPSGEVAVPIIVVHGDADDVINIEDSRELCSLCKGELITIAGGDHSQNDYLLNGPNQRSQFDTILDRLLATRQ